MTDLASLALKIDASQVDPAAAGLDRLAAAGKRAEGSTNSAGREWVRASSAAGKLRMEQLSASQAADRMAASNKGAGAAASQMAKEAQRAASTVNGVGKASGMARHHVQNLAFQLQDVAVGLASGQKPMTVFMQQGTQIASIMGQAGIGVGGLAKQVAMMAARFAPAAAAIGGAVAAMEGWRRHVNSERGAEIEAYARSIGLTAEQIEEAGGASVTASDLIEGLWEVIRDAIGLEDVIAQLGKWFMDTFYAVAADAKKNMSEIYGIVVATVKGISHVWGNLGPILGNAVIAGANAAIRALEWLVNKAIDGINKIAHIANPILAIANMAGMNTNLPHVNFGQFKDPYAGAGRSAAKAFTDAYAEGATEGARWIQSKIDAIEDAAVGVRKKKLAAALEDGGKKAGERAGKAAAKAANDNFEKELARQFKDAFKAEREMADRVGDIWADNSKIDEQIAALKREQAVIGKTGAEREKLLTLMEQEAEIRPILAQLADAEAQEQTAVAEALRLKIALIKERNSIKIANAEQTEQIAKQAEALERTNAELRDMIGLLQSIGGLGSVLGGALGFLTGNDDAIGGSLGFLLKMKSGGSTADADGKIIAKTIGDELRDVFGDFGKDLTVALKGAATGMVAANAVLGKQGAGGQIGSALGGAAGQILGPKLLGSLGAAAGPVGAIVGGLLGGVLGGLTGSLFKKTKWGRADISGVSSDPYMRGNSGKFESAAGDAATSVIKALNQIADELGGVAGEFGRISIGIRDGNWRVNTTGKSLKKSAGAMDFGEDGEAAVAYAVQQAIKMGAIDGLRQSTLNLLQAGGDFQAALDKALALESIFDEIAQAADPMGYELQKLAKRMTSVNALLVEANATQEEIQQVADYQAQQEAAIRARYAAEAAAKKAAQDEKEAELLALQGKATEALAKARAAELAQMDASLQAIQKQINAEQDAATRRGLQIQLLEAQGNILAAQELSRAEVLRVTLDENKAIQQKIWLTEDLFTAYNRESEALQNTADKMRGFSTTLREFRDSIYASDGSTSSYTQALAKLIQTGSLASTGDETALGNLPGVGKDFLDVAKNSAKSMLDFQRAQALVANYADQAIGYTDNAATVAEQQLAEMKTTVGALVTLNDSVISVEQAIERLAQHNAANTAPAPAPTTGTGQTNQGNSNRDLKDGFDSMRRMFEQMLRKWNQMAPEGPMQVEVIT